MPPLSISVTTLPVLQVRRPRLKAKVTLLAGGGVTVAGVRSITAACTDARGECPALWLPLYKTELFLPASWRRWGLNNSDDHKVPGDTSRAFSKQHPCRFRDPSAGLNATYREHV